MVAGRELAVRTHVCLLALLMLLRQDAGAWRMRRLLLLRFRLGLQLKLVI